MRHERDFAESPRAFIGVEQPLQRVGVLLGGHLDDAAALEGDAEAIDERAAVAERLGRADGAVDAILVGDGEDFFGRQVRRERNAVCGLCCGR